MICRNLVVILLLVLVQSSCTKADEDAVQAIQTYAGQKGWTLTDTAGVYVYIENGGNAEKPESGQTVVFDYSAAYLDGTVFDGSQPGSPVHLVLSKAMNGLKKGIPLFGRNGTGVIFITPSEGYRNSPPFGVREGDVLVYTVQIHDFY